MELSELRDKRRILEADLQRCIEEFIEETGCRPEITVYSDTMRSIGSPPRHVVSVSVEVKI